MTELDKVIDALERCLDGDEACPGCYLHDYDGCRDKLNHDALDHLTVYRDLLRRCGEGGELIRRSDVLKFPIRRDHYDREHGNPHFINGIETVMEYVEFIPPVESEPVVHAHWVSEIVKKCDWRGLKRDYYQPYSCPRCHTPDPRRGESKFCSECGAHMDEGVADDR